MAFIDNFIAISCSASLDNCGMVAMMKDMVTGIGQMKPIAKLVATYLNIGPGLDAWQPVKNVLIIFLHKRPNWFCRLLNFRNSRQNFVDWRCDVIFVSDTLHDSPRLLGTK